MEMFYLVMTLNYASVILPDTYQKDECHKVVAEISAIKLKAFCIPAPKKCYIWSTHSIGAENKVYKLEVSCLTTTNSMGEIKNNNGIIIQGGK